MTFKEFMALPQKGWLEAEVTEDRIVLRDVQTLEAAIEIVLEPISGVAAQAATRPGASAGHPNDDEQQGGNR